LSAFGTQFLSELLGVFLEASPYILLGFLVAALLQVLVPASAIQRLLGTGRVRSIFAASAIGIPLPLCSCSVLPTALSLRKRGASRGATVSFLVSTPETGVDSIALTYGLMDPLMAIYRPFSAMVSALTAGFAAEAFGKDDEEATDAAPESCCGPGEEAVPSAHSHGHAHDALAEGTEGTEAAEGRGSFRDKLRGGFASAFVELFDETSHWMLAGLVISAMIAVLLPAEIVTRYLSSGPVPLLLMLVIGIPLYICASASTPIAAALVIKGLSPGAALVFLLAGPATNIGSLAILSRFLGRRVMVIYISTIAILSLALGALLDVIYQTLNMDPGATAGQVRQMPAWLGWAAAIAFAALLVLSFRRAAAPREFITLLRGLEWVTGFRLTRRRLGALAVAVLGIWAFSSCWLVVPPGHQGLVRRFGAPSGAPRAAGLHWRWPPPIGTAELVSSDRVRRIEIGFRSPGEVTSAPGDGGGAVATRRLEEESLYLTGDENLLATRSVLQYRIVDPEKYVYGFRDPELAIKHETLAAMLDVLASFEIDRVYTVDRRLVETLVLDDVRRRTEDLDLGVEVVRFAIRDVHAPPEVHAAFRDVASAQEDKLTSINVAYRYLDETVNLARGEAARTVAEAQSFATREVHRARGESESLLMRSDAYREKRTGTFTRLYLETVEEVLSRGTKIVRPGWDGSGRIDLWISSGKGEPLPVGEVLRGGAIRRGEDPGDQTQAGE
jgi:HflK protein